MLTLPQQGAHVICEILADAIVAHQQAQASLGIDDVRLRAVVDRIAVAALSLLEVDLEFLGGALRGRQVTVKGEEARIEGADVLRELLWRVSLRINGDEKDLYPLGIRAEALQRVGDVAQCRGADVGAVREAEEQHHRLAAKVLEMTRLAVLVGELERPTVLDAGDVGALELRAGAVAGGEQRKATDNDRREARQTTRQGRQSNTGKFSVRRSRCTRNRCAARKRRIPLRARSRHRDRATRSFAPRKAAGSRRRESACRAGPGGACTACRGSPEAWGRPPARSPRCDTARATRSAAGSRRR